MKKAFFLSLSFFIFLAFAQVKPSLSNSKLSNSNYKKLLALEIKNLDPRIKAQIKEMSSQSKKPHLKKEKSKNRYKGEPTPLRFAEQKREENFENASEVSSENHSINSKQTGGSKDRSSVQIQTPTLVAPKQIQSVTIQNPVTTNSNASAYQESQSSSNSLHKLREKTEQQTQERIIENLEMFRINEERKRQQKIMNKLYEIEHGVKIKEEPDSSNSSKKQTQKNDPKPSKNEDKKFDSNQRFKNNSYQNREPLLKNSFISTTFGLSNYMNTKNMNQSYGGGFGFGYQFKKHFSLESSFLYVKHKVLQYYEIFEDYYRREEDTNYVYLNEYHFSLQGNYHLKNQSIFTPYFGSSLVFKYRRYTGIDVNYKDRSSEERSNRNRNSSTDSERVVQKNGTANTMALDVDGILGLDIHLSSRVSLGMEYKYELNLLNTNEKKPTYSYSGQKLQSIETIPRWFLGLKMKVLLD